MKLTASVIIRNELGRYLEPCVAHLLEFCDEVRILDDGSTDGWEDVLGASLDGDRIVVRRLETAREGGSDFRSHADARNELLQFSLEGAPTHVLAIDADEFVSDGPGLRRLCESIPNEAVLSLTMREVWQIDGDCLCVREDGGWRSHEVALLWRPDLRAASRLKIVDRGPATGRTPPLGNVRQVVTGASTLHFGWVNVAERESRYQRYAVHDGGQYHARAHLDSIMWPDERVKLAGFMWPESLVPYRSAILAAAGLDAVPR